MKCIILDSFITIVILLVNLNESQNITIIKCERNLQMGIIRVLHIIAGLNNGGAEAYIMNMYRNIDRTKVQFDFLIRSKNGIYEEEIKSMGGRIFYTSEYPRHFIKNKREVKDFFNKHKEYDIVHVHANALIYMTAIKLAKKNNIKCRIVHSHSVSSKNKILNILHFINKNNIKKYTTDCFACSTEAGKWMFGDEFILKRNAVDLNKFKPNTEIRKRVRDELNISDKFVIGHIGRFVEPKNHLFLIKLFKEYYESNPESVLLLVGGGPLESDIKELTDRYNITDAVKFLGFRNDVNEVLQAFDVFVFPSLFEGLPVSMIEAQVANIPCVLSSVISDEVMLTSLMNKVSLDDSFMKWIEIIDLVRYGEKENEEVSLLKIKNAGYDIETAARELQNFYIEKSLCEK